MSLLKRLVDFLAPLGFLLAVGAAGLDALRQGAARRPAPVPDRRRSPSCSLHLLLRWEDVARGLGRRQLKYGTQHRSCWSLVVLGILGAVNYLAVRHPKRFDLTKDQRYSLSDQTRKVLAGLKDDVKITYFQRQRDMARGQDRLKEYQALSPRLKIEFVDPVQSPAKAQAYDVRGPWPILVVETRRQARADHERRRAGHHERAHQDHPRGQEDGLLRRGRGRARRRGQRRARLLRRQGRAHQEPVRDQERLPAAREDGARGLHGARGRRPREGPAARDDRRRSATS